MNFFTDYPSAIPCFSIATDRDLVCGQKRKASQADLQDTQGSSKKLKMSDVPHLVSDDSDQEETCSGCHVENTAIAHLCYECFRGYAEDFRKKYCTKILFDLEESAFLDFPKEGTYEGLAIRRHGGRVKHAMWIECESVDKPEPVYVEDVFRCPSLGVNESKELDELMETLRKGEEAFVDSFEMRDYTPLVNVDVPRLWCPEEERKDQKPVDLYNAFGMLARANLSVKADSGGALFRVSL